MNDNTIDLGRTDEEVLTSEVSHEARLLLREFSHRINNEFTSAIGVISVAARSANDEAKVTLAAVEDRLQITPWCTMRCGCRSIPVASTRPHISDNMPGNQPFKT